METKKDRIKGIIGTILFHVIVLAVFMLAGFRTPLPLPEEIGVEIQGGSSLGSGDNIEMDAAASAKQLNTSSNAINNYATQNNEESYNIKKNNDVETNKNATEEEKPKKWVPDGSLLGKNDGSTNSSGNGSWGNSQGSGAGNNPGDGKGTGVGAGTGVGFDLNGRTASYLPEPSKNFSETGVIVVTIWVDRNGNVTRTSAGARGSTSTSEKLRKLALEAAKKSKFYPKFDALEEQMGTITYVFRLD
jgi:protein TonB